MSAIDAVAALLAQPDDRGAAARVRQMGPAALPRILEAVRDDPRASDVLSHVVGDAVGPAEVPLLAALSLNADVGLSQFPIQALGASRRPEALNPLTTLVAEPGPLVMRRRVAVEALAELRDLRAVPSLVAVVHELAPDEDGARAFAGASGLGALDHLRLLLDAVVSLFKLGEPRFAHIAVAIAGSPVKGADEAERWNIRAHAAHTLWIVTAPGMLQALRSGLTTEHAELRHNAAYALYHLGTVVAVPDLLAATASSDETLARAATNQLHSLIGSSLLASPTDLSRDWRVRAPDFTPDVCYRDGRPIEIDTLLGALNDEHRRPWLIEDLGLLTGIDFTTATAAGAVAWWRSLAHRQAPGVLLKWGYPQNLRTLV